MLSHDVSSALPLTTNTPVNISGFSQGFLVMGPNAQLKTLLGMLTRSG